MKQYMLLFLAIGISLFAGAEESVGPILGNGFAINPANSETVNITEAPPEATVNSVTVRIAGTAPFADLCTFQLRDSGGSIVYTFPTWFDEFSFDHTVTITDFAGRPVNQLWELWGQGSNTSGERVDQWWITVFYDEPLDPSVRITGPSTVEENAEVTLTATLTDMTGPFAYQWSLDGSPLVGATDSTFVIPAAQFSDSGIYTVTVTDGSAADYTSPDFALQVVAEGSLPASSLSMIGSLMLLVITAGALGISRRRSNKNLAD